MNLDYLRHHILGSLAGALIGDAMGSATESMTPGEIQERYGGWVSRFFAPPEGTFAAGRQPGQLTDDSTQMLFLTRAIVRSKGDVNVELVAQTLLEWAKEEELFQRFAGPTTRKALQRLREGKSPYETGLPEKMGMGISNGAAMKIAPAGLIHPGDLDAAVRDAVLLCVPTHNADQAYAGAGAIAAAIAAALVPGANLLGVVDAAIYGARKGYEIGARESVVLRAPSMVRRIIQAVEIAVGYSNFDEACALLADDVGCGLPLLETVPFAIGVFVAARGDPNRAIQGAVNMGGDADTTATVVGAVAGAYAGIVCIDPALYQQVVRVNQLDLESLAGELAELSQT